MMVFRWLFGLPDPQDPGVADTEVHNENSNGTEATTPEGTEPVEEQAGKPDENQTKNENTELSNEHSDDLSDDPLKVPLIAIPDSLLEDHPDLKLSEYDMSRGQYARNVLALTHNAVRLEIADMFGDILPSLQSRCKNFSTQPLDRDEIDDLRDWWFGFARFALTASLVEDMVTRKVFGDVYVGFDRDLRVMDKLYKKIQEKNNVSLELAVRNMDKAVHNFTDNADPSALAQLGAAWKALASTFSSIFKDSEELVDMVDRWVRNPFEYNDLEREATKLFTSKRQWSEDESKRGEMVVILCRWVGTEDLMRDWMQRNLTKRELRLADKWMDDYRDRRLAIVDRFHQRKVQS